MDNLNFYYFLLPSSLQIYKEEVNNWQAIGRQMFRVSPKTKNMLWILAIDSLLQFLIWLNITNFRIILLNTIFQRESNFADRQISSKSIQVNSAGPIPIFFFQFYQKKKTTTTTTKKQTIKLTDVIVFSYFVSIEKFLKKS